MLLTAPPCALSSRNSFKRHQGAQARGRAPRAGPLSAPGPGARLDPGPLAPAAEPAAKRTLGDFTLLSLLFMSENGKIAMEALREADTRVVRLYI